MKRRIDIVREEIRRLQLEEKSLSLWEFDNYRDGTVLGWEWRGYSYIAIKKVNKWWPSGKDYCLTWDQLVKKYIMEAKKIRLYKPIIP